MTAQLDRTRLERIRRHSERARTDRADLDAVLDDGFVGHLATVVDGEPWVVPMLYARDGGRILLHGSTGAGALRHVAAGAPVALSVTHVDGIVVAYNTFNSSANYRSAVVRGIPTPLTGGVKERALALLSDHVIPGRSAEVVANTAKAYAQTMAMALPIVDGSWTVKVRTGGPSTPEVETDAWTGVVPLRTHYGPVAPEPGAPSDLPASVARLLERNPS